MVTARMPLHINRYRHVATNAITAAFVFMFRRVNFRRFRIAAIVTAHAEVVALKRVFVGMRIVAVQADHAGLIHLAAQERFKFIVLVLDLAVWIPPLAIIQNFQ